MPSAEATLPYLPQVEALDLANLPALLDRAALTLTGAKSSAQVLEARDMAGTVYDFAKRTARLLRAKQAHDDLLAATSRAQGDALLIESQAKMRLADEYDDGQDRGEVASVGQPSIVPNGNDKPATAADLGLTRKEIHEARRIRDAEAASPGIVSRTVEQRLAAGQEPTKASIREVVKETLAPAVAWSPKDIVASPQSEKTGGESSSPGLTAAWTKLTAPLPAKPAPYIQGDTEVVHAIRQVKELVGPLGSPKAAMRRFPPQLAHSVTSDELFDLGRWFIAAAKEWQEIEGASRVAAE